jgi:hypothetical protein
VRRCWRSYSSERSYWKPISSRQRQLDLEELDRDPLDGDRGFVTIAAASSDMASIGSSLGVVDVDVDLARHR